MAAGLPAALQRGGSVRGSAVREPWLWRRQHAGAAAAGVASMGPRSENRGYVPEPGAVVPVSFLLQWVHGPRTVVMRLGWDERLTAEQASMGPRSENRGYAR